MQDQQPIEHVVQFEPIIIRYEGLDAERHEIELGQLGESIQGFAKAIAVAANYAYTGNAAVHYDALDVRVLAVPVKEHHCFELWAQIQPIVMTKEFWAGAVVAVGGVLTPVLSYIFSKRTGEEMKHLSDALQLSIGANQAVTEKLVSTVEKLADALNPSVRKALAPIDRSCAQIDLYQAANKVQSMDTETKKAFSVGGSKVADHSKQFTGVISELNMLTGTCQVMLDGNEKPVAGKILDPVCEQPNNPYATALASQMPIAFVAKYELDAEGVLTKLHIFDTADD